MNVCITARIVRRCTVVSVDRNGVDTHIYSHTGHPLRTHNGHGLLMNPTVARLVLRIMC